MTQREQEVLDLLGANLTHEEIGRRLFISVRTVESHVASLRRKLDIPDHRTLVRLAAEHRLTAGHRSHAPPLPLTSFVGRASELAGLAAALEAARLVTVTGPGGVGKTRLALSAARSLAARFGDHVCWTDLVPVATADDLADAVAAACDAVATSRRGPAEAVIAALADRPALVVLDNCEHVVSQVAALAERILTACPGVTMLLTSRLRLAVAFERVFAVPTLSAEPGGDAVALFCERAAAAGTELGGAGPEDRADRERVAAICSALGGLPLAIELAAVRLPALGLDGVERGLATQSDLLTGGGRAVLRHRSMAQTLDWSAALLSPAAARTLRRLAVFRTPFQLPGAATVATDPPDLPGTTAALAELTEHNLLVTTHEAGRLAYRMLEPVRQYGIATMAAEDRLAFDRHARWCLDAAQPHRTGRSRPRDAAVTDELRSALHWAEAAGAAAAEGGESLPASLGRALGLLLYRSGRLAEAQDALEHAAALAGDPGQASAELRRAAAVAKCRIRGPAALRLELAAAALAAAAGDPTAAAQALTGAGELLNRFPGMFGPQAGDGRPFLARATALVPASSRVAAAAQVAAAAYAPAGTGRPDVARASRALDAARAAGDPLLESSALDTLTSARLFALDVQAAHALAQDRIARLRELDPAEPAVGLELKDALHIAILCALGAGFLTTALGLARAQRDLPYLRESRDLAEDEMIAPLALGGDLTAAADAGERFLRDWNADGRPTAAGRAITPAAVALAHGLLGDRQARQAWLAVTAEMRGEPVEQALAGTGYGELFEAMVLVREGRPADAFAVLTAPAGPGLYSAAFHQWSAALTAEAAVLAGRQDAWRHLARARQAAAGNPAAASIADRAARTAAAAVSRASRAEPTDRPGPAR